MKILVGGDLVLGQPDQHFKLDNSISELFKVSDLNIVNLEAPLTKSNSKILKTGPHLKTDNYSTLQILKGLKIEVVTLANNHILDYDEQGLSDTLVFCRKNSIQTVGAGMDFKEASKTLYLETGEGSLAIVNFTENEWTCATEKSAGANPMDLVDNYRQIQEARMKADFVLAIVHGGNEYNPYPSPRMVKQYRFYAEIGADVVIGHHTHCISGYERHRGVPIFYSLGNFLFTMGMEKPDSWYSGLVVQLEIKNESEVGFEVIPVCQDKERHVLSIMEVEDKNDTLKLIYEINDVIADSKRLKEKWEAFVERVQGGFIKSISPLGGIKNRYLKAALYRSGLYKLLFHKRYLKEHLNRIRCEAHLDVMKTMLTSYLEDEQKIKKSKF